MKNGSATATWAGISSFFATLLAVGVIDIFNPSDQLRLISSIVVGAITGGAVFSKQKLDDAKKAQDMSGTIHVTHVGPKQIYSLELEGDPEKLEHQQKVIFEVNREEGRQGE